MSHLSQKSQGQNGKPDKSRSTNTDTGFNGPPDGQSESRKGATGQATNTVTEGHISQPFFPGEDDYDDLKETWGTPPSIMGPVSVPHPPSNTPPGKKPKQSGGGGAPRRGRRRIPMLSPNGEDSTKNTSSKSAAFSWSNILSFKSGVSSILSTGSRKSALMPAFDPNSANIVQENNKDDAKAKYLETETGKILKETGLPEVKKQEEFEPEPQATCCFGFLF